MIAARRETPGATAGSLLHGSPGRRRRWADSSRRSQLRAVGRVALLLLAALLGACGRGGAATREPSPAHLELVPCGGAARVQLPESSEWVAFNRQIVVEAEITIETEGEEGAGICPGDGSLRLLARELSYQVATSACPVSVTDVPARIRLEQREVTTHLMVEQGSAVCASGVEPTMLPMCWELVTAPDEEPQIAQYCGAEAEVAATDAVPATSTVLAVSSPTGEAIPATLTPSPPQATVEPTAELTSTPEPTPRATATLEPTPIP